MLIQLKTNVVFKKLVLIVHIPKSTQSDDVLDALYTTRTLSIAAERSRYNILIADVSTMLLSDTEVGDTVQSNRARLLEMLWGQVFSAVYYSGSGLSSEYLRDVVRAAHAGDTPIQLSLPPTSTLARFINSFKFRSVTRVE